MKYSMLLNSALAYSLDRLPLSNGFVTSYTEIAWKKFYDGQKLSFSAFRGKAEDDFAAFEDNFLDDKIDEQKAFNAKYVEAIPTLSSVVNPEAVQLREQLLALAEDTNKGFSSSQSQKERARDLIYKLANYNPSSDPALPYYAEYTASADSYAVTLAGKWDLIYTDAPDITSLDTSRNPLALASLGRIGQQCDPPYIKNVIEWRKPEWSNQLPLLFLGNNDSRILQKVCVKARASAERPFMVDLELVGIDFVASPSTKKVPTREAIIEEGLPSGLLRKIPIELRGPLTAPFGQFEILYLDEEMRIVRTGQNYLAVNLRSREEWF